MKIKQILTTTNFSKLTTKSFSTIKIQIPKPFDFSEIDVKDFPQETTTTPEELLRYYKTLTLWRQVEYAADELYKAKEIRGFCHLYIGQESIALGMDEGLTFKDPIITAYREHCQTMSRGYTYKQLLAEMMSRATGATKGKGGSMHYYNKQNGFFGGHGIVGAQIPMGTGLAFALKYKGNTENACFTMYGDGSTNQGQLLEASNMAGLMKLPVVYVIENNKFAMGTAENRHNHHTPIFSKFRSFPGLKIDAQDVFNVREWTKYCKQYVIKNGPMFLELDTYRYQGHSMSDPGISYRSKEDVLNFRKSRDCITKIMGYILTNKVATEKDLKDIENEIKDKLVVDIDEIKKDPLPALSEMYTEVYDNQDTMFIRGTDLDRNSLHFNLLENNKL
jgi:pyruvate dehydrogenase E1 component alpha subunit